MRLYFVTLVIVLTLVGSGRCFPQGFLNPESASVSGNFQGESVPAQNAFPDWPAYFEPANDATYSEGAPALRYDGISIGGSVVAVQNTNASPRSGPIHGRRSVPMRGSSSTATTTAVLERTGTIPLTGQSLVFSTNLTGTLDVSINGHALTLVDVSNAMNDTVVDVSNAMNYTNYQANFPAYARQTDPLPFTSPVETATVFDNIPDPNTF